MPTKDELEKLPNVDLAVLCGKIVNDAEHFTEENAAKAGELKVEWASLQTPPEAQLKDEQKKREQVAGWRTRAAEFLAAVL